jgi:epoxyqueuosine reductase
MDGYDERLSERAIKVPESAGFYKTQRRLTRLREQYPWANSAVVTVSHRGRYRMQEQLEGHIGKHYIFDARANLESSEYKRNTAMEEFLRGMVLKTESNRNYGIVGLRWAAMKAGLGIIRKNNFFYTESGSWVSIDAWLVDEAMQLLESSDLPACPEACSNCVKACPTASLSSAYAMNPTSCVSYLTTFGSHNFTINPLGKRCGTWIYGCDACQDACSFNRGKWAGDEEFPGVRDRSPHLTAENILKMHDAFYRRNIQPKFFYILPDELWKWKINALNFMRNNYRDDYRQYITEARSDESEQVREFANRICAELY